MNRGQADEGDSERSEPSSTLPAPPLLFARLQACARERDRLRFAQVLDDAADFLDRHGELPDAVRWLRKEAAAWRSPMR